MIADLTLMNRYNNKYINFSGNKYKNKIHQISFFFKKRANAKKNPIQNRTIHKSNNPKKCIIHPKISKERAP